MFFDFFSIKIYAESKATDECFVGYFFGKAKEKLEYKFVCFPRRYKGQMSVDLNLPLSSFKEYLTKFYQELLVKSADVSEMTGEFMRYINLQIKKNGGREALSVRLSKIIQNEENDIIRMEINDLFQNWTSSLEMELVVETSTYEELTNSFLGEIDNEHFLSSITSRNDLMSLPEVYPIVDPLDGVSIDNFDIGDSIYCTILGFSDEDEQRKVIEEFPDHFDAENHNTVPLEATIVSKEILPSVSKNFVLIKVQIGAEFVAKSVVLRSIRLMYDPDKMHNRLSSLKEEANEEALSLAEVMNKYRKMNNVSVQKLEDEGKSNFGDFFLTLVLLLMITGLVIIIVYFFLLS